MENIDINKKYSTDEVFTGEYWVDNKPIYKKSWVVAGSDFTKQVSGSRALYYLNDGLTVSNEFINLIKCEGYWLTTYWSNNDYKNRRIPLFGTAMNTDDTVQFCSCVDYYDWQKKLFPFFEYYKDLQFYSDAVNSLNLTAYYTYL